MFDREPSNFANSSLIPFRIGLSLVNLGLNNQAPSLSPLSPIHVAVMWVLNLTACVVGFYVPSFLRNSFSKFLPSFLKNTSILEFFFDITFKEPIAGTCCYFSSIISL